YVCEPCPVGSYTRSSDSSCQLCSNLAMGDDPHPACVTCTENGCTSCATGYFLTSGHSCLFCGDDCPYTEICEINTNFECASDEHRDLIPTNPTYGKCVTCPFGCTSCDERGCLDCIEGYGLFVLTRETNFTWNGNVAGNGSVSCVECRHSETIELLVNP